MGDVPIRGRFMSIKCLCGVVRGLISLIIYLIAELLLFCVVLGASHGISGWLQGIFYAVTWHQSGSLLQTYFLVYSVGILATQVTKYHHDLVPTRALELRRRCPLFFGVLRILIIITSLFGGTWFLFQSYDWKYNEGGGRSEVEKLRRKAELEKMGLSDEPMLNCDNFFTHAVLLLAYVYARVTESYREVNRVEVERKYWGMRPRRVISWPPIHFYLFYFGSLVMLEVVITLVCAALLVLNCIVMQSLFQKEVATFIVTCVTGAGLGYVVAIFEERWSPFDEYYGKFEPFFSTIHWDARQNIIVFSILPSLSRWYFNLQFEGASGPFFNFAFYAGSVSTTLLVFMKCQTFFSFLIPEDDDDLHPFQLRIHPETGELGGNRLEIRRAGMKLHERLLGGLQHLLRSILSPHFTSSGQPRGDFISVSTGTCTTLMNRMTGSTPPEELVTLPPAPVFTDQDHLAPCPSFVLTESSPPLLPPTDINCNLLIYSPTPELASKAPDSHEALSPDDKENNNQEELEVKEPSIHGHFVQTSTPPPSPQKKEANAEEISNVIVPTHENDGKVKESRAITLRKCQAFAILPTSSSSSEHNNSLE